MIEQDRIQQIREHYKHVCDVDLSDEEIEKIIQLDRDFSTLGFNGFLLAFLDVIKDHVPVHPNQSLIK